MDNFLSLSISLGIAAFGLWAIVTVESLPCTVLAPLPIIVAYHLAQAALVVSLTG